MFALQGHSYENKMASQPNGEKIQNIYLTKSFIHIHKELLQHTNKKTNSSVKYRQRRFEQITQSLGKCKLKNRNEITLYTHYDG